MRIRKSTIQINMFPFLSVLCAVIGVLMLFLMLIISARIVDDSQTRTPDRPSAGPGQSATQLTEEDLTRLRAALAELTAQVSAEHAALNELLEQRDELRELLALKRESRALSYGDSLFVGVELSADVSVFMKPADGVRVTKQPKFIEVNLTEYVIHPEGERFSVNDLPNEDRRLTIDHQPTTTMERFLAGADRRRDREYLVFLVRASGCESFDRVKDYLVRRYPHPRTRELSRIDMGWEPFAPEWLLAIENADSQ